jgi:hypothetical protein
MDPVVSVGSDHGGSAPASPAEAASTAAARTGVNNERRMPRRYCFAASSSACRSSMRRILPVSVFGSSSTNSILRG